MAERADLIREIFVVWNTSGDITDVHKAAEKALLKLLE